MTNTDFNPPQSPWSFPQTLPQSWRSATNKTTQEEPSAPPPLPPQRQAGLGDLASQQANAGGFSTPEPTDQSVPHTTPGPDQQHPHQRYVSSRTDRPPGEWGDPDWALKGAQGYPGMPAGPYMPQGADMWGLVHSISDGLGQGGSNYVGLPARQMGMYSNNMSKAFVEGQLAGYRLNYARLQQSLMLTAQRQQEELTKYKEQFAIWGPHEERGGTGDDAYAYRNPGDPERLAQEIGNLATQYDDPVLKSALENGGVAAAERVLATRDGKSQDAQKILQMQKSQLEIEKLKIQIEKLKKGDPAGNYENQPEPEETPREDEDNTRAPGAEPPAGDEDKPWPKDLLPPDEPEQPAPGGQPQPAAPTSGAPAAPGAAPATPQATPGAQGAAPAGGQQVAGGAAPGTASDAPVPGVGAGAPVPAISGGMLRPGQPLEPPAPIPPPSPETRERPRPVTGGLRHIDEVLEPYPADRMPRGFNADRLDNAARFYLENGKLPYTAADKNE